VSVRRMRDERRSGRKAGYEAMSEMAVKIREGGWGRAVVWERVRRGRGAEVFR